MATMVKEKRREKKKVKEKTTSRSNTEEEQPSLMNISKDSVETPTTSKILEPVADSSTETREVAALERQKNVETISLEHQQTTCTVEHTEPSSLDNFLLVENIADNKKTENRIKNETSNRTQVKSAEQELYIASVGNTYKDINSRLERMTIPSLNQNLNMEDLENRLEKPEAYLDLSDEVKEEHSESFEVLESQTQENTENAVPSAPIFEEDETIQYFQQPENVVAKEIKRKPKSMPLEEAVKLFGGTEMEAVRVMSEKEEAIVEAGPVSGPEHPLVDLLSTFRSSLIAVDREHLQLSKGYIDEEKFRKGLWKIEKLRKSASETCACGAIVTVHFTYEHAELLKEKLPVAKLKLEGLLRDVQESYCHHQHTALLTHCQIEELISEVTKSNKKEIREALALVLRALRLSDSAPASLAAALERWAAALSAAMLDARDARPLLHLIHHLTRQTRSVRWASRVVRSYIRAGDRGEAAQAIALLQLLVAKPRLEAAVECTEDADESWEEMDKTGGSGAVSEGALRERDLLALLRAFPARELVARILLFEHNDISQAREQDWGDRSYGSGVLKACCGIRTLLMTLQHGVTSHHAYPRLRAHLKGLAVSAMHALSGLHLQCRECYSQDLEDRISAELEAIFCAGVNLLGDQHLQEVPATLLDDHTAREYCCVNILALHDTSSKQLDFLPLELPLLPCSSRVALVSQLALDRHYDHELARTVLEFLFQTGIRRASAVCPGGCRRATREQLPRVLHTHSYLHTAALHMLAEHCQVEQLDPSAIEPLSAASWRPNTGEVKQVLEDWSFRCPQLVQHLLLHLEYTPHVGLSLDAQLTIISWLCDWVRQSPAAPPEWAWSVLRRARPHRTWWGAPPHAPPPCPPPTGLFSKACAVLTSSWGHSIPEICSDGLEALCALAAARPGDAAHCLGPVMLLMAHSPESISLTPKFTELLSTLLSAGPTLVQRALGFGPERGADLLQRLILSQLEHCPGVSRSSLVSAWLHALWKPSLPSHGLLETILLASREWLLFDAHAARLIQDTNASEVILSAVRNVTTAPLVCACVLRARAGEEARGGGRLLDVLHVQRGRGEKIHVDNALKHIGANMSSEDLVIYRCATALLSAPTQQPAHLTLWAFFFHLYLQRPPSSMMDSTSPVGPLFFSGLLKSRVFIQLRKKLQETVTYHHTETESLKQNTREETPQAPSRSKTTTKNATEDDVLPKLLSWDSSESSESKSDSDGVEESEEVTTEVAENKEDLVMALKYHAAAENMCKEFLRWLDEGERTRAMPHHADIARFLPEQVLDKAWSVELASRHAPRAAPPPPAAPPAPPPRPFYATVARILAIKDCSKKRPRKPSVKSPLDVRELSDARRLLSLVDKYLADMETLAEEWSSEASRISSLDGALWELVCKLRVPRPLPPVRKQCGNKCAALTIHAPMASLREWCISTGAERGIEDNRRTARGLTRRLARPRPHAARSAAALMTIARHVSSPEAARRVCERAWSCARAAHCAPVAATLTALVDALADRWLCNNGKICSELLSRWGNNTSSSLQQSLCGALVAPRRLPAPQWPAVYCCVLRSRHTPHVAFSYLSKFEMSRWVEVADPGQKRELLEALLAAAQRYGPDPDAECHVLLELLGVHTATLLNPLDLSAHVTACARASAARTLPPSHWSHVIRAAHCHALNVPFDQLGHLLRSLGSLWWEVRLSGGEAQFDAYAQDTAELLRALVRAFTASTKALSYTPERVCLYVWSALQESWSPWLSPHHKSPLQSHAAHAATLHTFVQTILQVMNDCPGIEEDLLLKAFEWVVMTYLGAVTSPAQESRVQMTSLLEGMRALPWTEHQWLRPTCLQVATQVCASSYKDLQSWCSAAWRGISAESWVRGVDDSQTAPLLASLLYLFTAMTHHEQTLEQATLLPWRRLPERALEEALERFFVQHHNPTLAYHDLPQFRVILFASELLVPPSPLSPSPAARHKRSTALSRWTCAACAPTLAAHVPTHATHVLQVLTDIAPYLEGSEGELEELLSRALAVMCIEPAAGAALPVWCTWVSGAPAQLVRACVSAAGGVTAFQYFAALADASIRAHCTNRDCGDWGEVFGRVAPSPWRDAAPLAQRARLHAAYAVLRAHTHSYDVLRTTFNALLDANVNFIEDEAIVALWICVCCSVAASSEAGAGVGAGAGAEEAGAAARGALARAAGGGRRSLLHMVTMSARADQHTDRHRLLARLALCILTPSESAARAYEASCAAVLGSTSDALAWGKAPRPKHLPRLAIRLFPNAEKYFKYELDLADE